MSKTTLQSIQKYHKEIYTVRRTVESYKNTNHHDTSGVSPLYLKGGLCSKWILLQCMRRSSILLQIMYVLLRMTPFVRTCVGFDQLFTELFYLFWPNPKNTINSPPRPYFQGCTSDSELTKLEGRWWFPPSWTRKNNRTGLHPVSLCLLTRIFNSCL